MAIPRVAGVALLLLASGCSARRTQEGADLRKRMEAAVAPDDGVQQVRFAHIGELDTPEGVFHVATQFNVLTGMLCPRGLPRRVFLFDDHARVVSRFDLWEEPLWCEGTKIYLGGPLPVGGVDVDPRVVELCEERDCAPCGNVLDFTKGATEPVLTREWRYGSSGGIEDDPWSE